MLRLRSDARPVVTTPRGVDVDGTTDDPVATGDRLNLLPPLDAQAREAAYHAI